MFPVPFFTLTLTLSPQRLCRNREIERNIVMPAKAGTRKLLKIPDSASRFACAE